MKTPSDLIIRIPEPCHEPWDKMQPNDKGRFCSSCQKSVIDFTGKTDPEIRDILLAQAGRKVCGHFRKTQVARPLQLSVNINALPRNLVPRKAFAIALFLVFGTMLFSCYDHQDKKINDIEMNDRTNKDDDIAGAISVRETVREADAEKPAQVGDPSVKGEMELRGDVVIEELTGKVAYNDPVDSLIKGGIKTCPTDVADTTGERSFESEEQMTGLIGLIEVTSDVPDTLAYDPVPFNRGEDIGIQNIPDRESVQETGPDSPGTIEAGLRIYPNPAKDAFIIQYDVLKRSDILLEIFDEGNRHITTVVNTPNQHEGKYHIPVDLSGRPAGIYLVVLLNNGKRVAKKLVIER